jgi:hypothetical protein
VTSAREFLEVATVSRLPLKPVMGRTKLKPAQLSLSLVGLLLP